MYRILLRIKRFLKRYLKIKAETRQAEAVRPLSNFRKILMLLIASALVGFLYPAENLFNPVDVPRRGEIATKDIIAPFRIVITKSEKELAEERESMAEAVPIVIDYDKQLVDSILSKFDRFIDLAKDVSKTYRNYANRDEINAIRLDSLSDSLRAVVVSQFPIVNPGTVDMLFDNRNIDIAAEIIKQILVDEIYFTGVLPNLEAIPETSNRSVIVRIGKREIFVNRNRLMDLSKAYMNYLAALNARSLTDTIDVEEYYELGRHFIVANLDVNLKEMNARRDEVMAELSPTREVIQVGDVIVRSGQKISARQADILQEMYRLEGLRSDGADTLERYLPIFSRFVLVMAIFAALYLYLYYFRRQVYYSNPKILALFLIYGLELLFIYFIGIRFSLSIYLYPVAIFSILVTVLFDSEIGVINTFILALLLGLLHRFDFAILLLTISAGLVASFSTQRVRQRSEFFRSVIYLMITYIVLVVILDSFELTPGDDLSGQISYGLVNAVLSPLLAMGILPIFESLFGFTTNITLLELSDLNHPLLKRLALEAPGTYHHSILVGNLAESAAKAINGNPLLARVGAYYHDIGKMEIPEYFVENQYGIKSKHESLTPTMSSIILSSHIKKGRLIGEDADLPDEVLNFIEEHHGTMTMTYFYNKAKEMGVEAPSADEFKYPGPKPQTRETAIVMLADSVEAASRTLTDPKPARVKNLVQNIINDRFQSGELEECPLTLKDLAQIRESFAKILMGVFHQRIDYPDKEEEEK